MADEKWLCFEGLGSEIPRQTDGLRMPPSWAAVNQESGWGSWNSAALGAVF